MSKRFLNLLILAVMLLTVSGCAPVPTPAPEPVPTPIPEPPELPSAPTPSVPHRVKAVFDNAWVRYVEEDRFSSQDLGGMGGDKLWRTRLKNSQDESGLSVAGLTYSFTTDEPFEVATHQDLMRMGPPEYGWFLGDITEGHQANVEAGFSPWTERFPFVLIPGFDVSRSVDKTEFTAADTQTLTITVTPGEEHIGELYISVRADEDAYVAPVITPHEDEEHAEMSADGQELTIYGVTIEANNTLSVIVSIEIEPKVPAVEFIPEVTVGWRQILDSGTSNGSSISRAVEAIGTRTLEAKGEYIWDWIECSSHLITWRSHSGGAATAQNEILVDSCERWAYEVHGDTFTSKEVRGRRNMNTILLNTPDITGAPVKDLVVTFTSQLEPTNWFHEYLVELGPPVYEWHYGDEPEKPLDMMGKAPEAFVEFGDLFPCVWTAGLDVSRSVDKTVFTTTGVQTLTITITPREENIHFLALAVHTLIKDQENVVDAIILDAEVSSPKGERVTISPDGRDLYIEPIPIEVDTPWTVTATIRVTPKVPKIEFVPFVGLNWFGLYGGASTGVTRGNFVTCDMGTAGVWTWEAEGDYIWNINNSPPILLLGLRHVVEQLEN